MPEKWLSRAYKGVPSYQGKLLFVLLAQAPTFVVSTIYATDIFRSHCVDNRTHEMFQFVDSLYELRLSVPFAEGSAVGTVVLNIPSSHSYFPLKWDWSWACSQTVLVSERCLLQCHFQQSVVNEWREVLNFHGCRFGFLFLLFSKSLSLMNLCQHQSREVSNWSGQSNLKRRTVTESKLPTSTHHCRMMGHSRDSCVSSFLFTV